MKKTMQCIAIFLLLYGIPKLTFSNSEKVMNILRPSGVFVYSQEDLILREKKNLRSKKMAKIPAYTEMEVIKSTEDWYLVRDALTGEKGYAHKENLIFMETPTTHIRQLRVKDVENFVNGLDLGSKSDYLILTQISMQKTFIFIGTNHQWKMMRMFSCGTGLDESPTMRGVYEIYGRGLWFYSERFQSGAMYWLRYSGSYLYHSQAMNEKKEIIDESLGEKCSQGCIRLKLEDSKWMYENIPDGTKVFVR